MKKSHLKNLLLLLSTTLLIPTITRAANWQLVWSDEFNTPGLPDKTKWTYETGFIRNNEAQIYTKDRPENVRIEDGNLVIECRKEHFPNPTYNPNGRGNRAREFAEYTSGSINTQKLAEFTYGKIEIRAKIPQGLGTWPAAWMLGTNISKVSWPRCGEIDIMEFVGKDPNHIHATTHWFGLNPHPTDTGNNPTAAAAQEKPAHQSHTAVIKTPNPYDDFHTYTVEWTHDKMDFYFDTTKYLTFNIDDAGKTEDNAFRKPQYLLLNFAIGGAWGGKIDDSKLPQKYLIDYVRIYQDKDAAPTTQPTHP